MYLVKCFDDNVFVADCQIQDGHETREFTNLEEATSWVKKAAKAFNNDSNPNVEVIDCKKPVPAISDEEQAILKALREGKVSIINNINEGHY